MSEREQERARERFRHGDLKDLKAFARQLLFDLHSPGRSVTPVWKPRWQIAGRRFKVPDV